MENNCFIAVFGTFGSPNGFTQSYYSRQRKEALKLEAYDLQTSAITIYPDTKLYAIRKEVLNNTKAISFSIYTYAKEKNSGRGGTFIGNSLIFGKTTPATASIIQTIEGYNTFLRNKNLNKDELIVSHSDELQVPNLNNDLDIFKNHSPISEDIAYSQKSQNLLVYCNTQAGVFEEIIERSKLLLSDFHTIYFTSDKQIMEFTLGKGLFHVLDKNGVNEYAEKIEQEKQKSLQSAISKLEQTIKELESERSGQTLEYRSTAKKNKELHESNSIKIQESEENLKKIEDYYGEFAMFLDKLISELKNGRLKQEDAARIYNENRKKFSANLQLLVKPQYIESIEHARLRTNLRSEIAVEKKTEPVSNHPEPEGGKKTNLFKWLTFVASFLWIGTIVFFLSFNNPPEKPKEKPQAASVQTPAEDTSINATPAPPTVKTLTPASNGYLSDVDKGAVTNRIRHGMSINQVVDTIFAKHPKDIGKHYQSQKEAYAQELLKQNQECFSDNKQKPITRNGIPVYSKGVLKNIPSYKPGKVKTKS